MFRALIKGSPAGVEHLDILDQLDCATLIDIGANRGQFAIAARYCWPEAQIYSFEPLIGPARTLSRVFEGDDRVRLFQYAIGNKEEEALIHVSRMDDSSSLLPISQFQDQIFPGTYEIATRKIQSYPLDQVLNEEDIAAPAMLKIDVQGYELNVLRGSKLLLRHILYVYVECSFLELYQGQPKAHEVIAFLHEQGFNLSGVYNLFYTNDGKAIQGDFLFQKSE